VSPDVDIAPLDITDDQLLQDFWQASHDAATFGRPYATFPTYDDTVTALRNDTPTREVVAFVARDGDAVLGGATLTCPLLDNQRMAHGDPLVRPQSRNRGVGTALLDAVVEAMRERGRTTLVVEATKPLDEPTSPGWDFLHHRGFTTALLDLHRVLTLPVEAARLDELAAESAPHCRDYELKTWQGATPDEWVEGVCELQAAFNDEAPSGELDIEREVWDEERLRSKEERLRALGRTETTTVAIARDGDVVALTEMMVTENGRGPAFQGGTLVLPAHRGHRLGTAIKVASLRRFQDTFPGERVVHSWNAEENGPMVAINDALGFRPVEHVAEMQRRW
jgi:GNAT superfamily N-acetyltransferase